MRALQHCDFCDRDAAGVFEIVPAELEPSDDEQRRVLLCGDCETQLGTLLEPLLARLNVEGVDGTAVPTGASDVDDANSTDEDETDGHEAESDTDEAVGETTAGGDEETVDGTEETVDEASETVEEDGTATEDESRPPNEYARVMRLLRNREFPMDRGDAASVAAGAYELEEEEVGSILEYAVETDEFDEDGDQLVRP